jgi:8-amino-7-oxononanoate synthase
VKHPPGSAPTALAFLADDLARLEQDGLLRRRPPTDLGRGIDFASNDYLGLAAEVAPRAALGAGASRLISGQRREHERLEEALADWLDQDRAVVFSSGYAANVGTLSALARAGDLLLSDALNHASLIDGARLSRAEVVVYPHLDLGAVQGALASARAESSGPQRRVWVVTESYFSMDADSPDLRELRALCDEARAALVVDEAHALGVFGPEGRGICAEQGVVPDVLIGTLSKALGASGAFVAGCEDLAEWLWNRARSFVFSTGMSPAVAEGARLNLLRSLRMPELRKTALTRATELRAGLERLGLPVRGHGMIVPWVLGDAGEALRIASNLREQGVFVQAIRPPTVPEKTCRLRLTTTARHAPNDIERALEALGTCIR